MDIDTLEGLRALYGPAKERSVRKQLATLDAHCRHFIALSPFVVLASTGANGMPDASPRGGAPGFVCAPDPGTLLVPDASGNNRLDTLVNIVETGRLGLLFMVPGIDETLRVNGAARLSTDPALLAQVGATGPAPRLVIRVEVAEAYLHCAKSLMRSRLWDVQRHVPRATLPTMGQMLKDQIGGDETPETQAQMIARYTAEL
jgi:PPOX class probable FMN-dependent enzyme